MALDLKLIVPEKPQSVTFRIVPSLLEEFDLYVKAAQEENPDITADAVMSAILEKHLKKDKGFKMWKQAQTVQGHEPEPQNGE